MSSNKDLSRMHEHHVASPCSKKECHRTISTKPNTHKHIHSSQPKKHESEGENLLTNSIHITQKIGEIKSFKKTQETQKADLHAHNFSTEGTAKSRMSSTAWKKNGVKEEKLH